MGNLFSVHKVPIFGVIVALLVLAILLFATQFSSTAAADESKLKHFIGLWMAADPSDGGFINLSITDNDEDDLAELNLNETFVSTCLGGRALINGSGSVGDDGDLGAKLTIQCLEDTTNDPKGDPVGPIPVVFEAIGTDIIEFTVPVIPGFLPVALHRVSITEVADDQMGLADFIGLWMAVDPSDGGFINLSITDNDRDRVAELNLNETFVSTCLGGRALINGSGSLDDVGDLQAQLTIQCLEDTTNDPKGDPVGPIPVVLEAIGNNIIEFTVPVIPNFLPVALHRVSPTQETDLSDHSIGELFEMEEAGDITTEELVAELERRNQSKD